MPQLLKQTVILAPLGKTFTHDALCFAADSFMEADGENTLCDALNEATEKVAVVEEYDSTEREQLEDFIHNLPYFVFRDEKYHRGYAMREHTRNWRRRKGKEPKE